MSSAGQNEPNVPKGLARVRCDAGKWVTRVGVGDALVNTFVLP